MADEWLLDAVCVGTSPDVFYDDIWPEDRGYNLDLKALHKARAICNSCPVRRECLLDAMRYEDGLSVKSRGGVWGGLTPAQRRSLDVRRAELYCGCGAVFDPLMWIGRELVCADCGRHVAVSSVPDEGDQWDDRHTELAQRIISSIHGAEVDEAVPNPKAMSATLDASVAEVRRVYHEFVLTGVLQLEIAGKRKLYRLRAEPLHDWAPSHKQEPC